MASERRPLTVLPVDFFDLMAHIDALKDEAERYKRLYEQAVAGRAAFRDAFRRAAELQVTLEAPDGE